MAVKVIIKPGGLVLIAFGVLALSAQAIRQSGSSPKSDLASPASTTAGALLPEEQFWSTSDIPGEKAMVVETNPLVRSGSGKVVHIATKAPHKEVWLLQAGTGIPDGIAAGEQRTVHFWARTDAPKGELDVAVEFNTEPYEKFVMQPVTLTQDWKEYSVPVTFTKELPKGKGNISFHAGKLADDVYISGVRF